MEEKDKRNFRLSKVGTAVFLLSVAIAFLSLAVAPVMAEEDVVTVTVNAPESVEKGESFDVTIGVDSITDFNLGLFDLSFDHKVVEVEDVTDGSIDGTTIPVNNWGFEDRDRIRVFLEVSGVAGVSGSGYLAKINFKVEGNEGDECLLGLFLAEGALANNDAEEIKAEVINAIIRVEEKKDEEDIEQSPSITAREPTEEAVSSTEGESITVEISVDQEVDISWQINGTEVQVDEGVTKAAYTNTSAVAGTWNVSAIATNTETGLSCMRTWIWSVTPAATEASEGTPTLAPGVTPTPTPKATSSPSQAVKATPTVKPTPTPKSKETAPTPTSKTPGFEAIFAIAAMSAIAYALVKRR